MLPLVLSGALGLAALFGGFYIAGALGLTAIGALLGKLNFNAVLSMAGMSVFNSLSSFSLTAAPMFILAGDIFFQIGILEDCYKSVERLVRWLPGKLIQVNIATCTLFAACTGSSIASAATMSALNYPSMKARGYKKSVALASVAAGGTLGILIPPSIPMILFGALTEVSIADLFIGGLLPGILMAVLFMIYVGIHARLDPSLVGQELGEKTEAVSFKDAIVLLSRLWPIVAFLALVLGGIYGGIATPTEVAVLAVVFVCLVGLAKRRLTFQILKKSAMGAVLVMAFIGAVMASATMLSAGIAVYNVFQPLTSWFASLGLSYGQMYLLVCVFYIFLGCIMDFIGMLYITMPIVFPIVMAMGFNPVYFGVIFTILAEIGQMTPPVGLNLFVVAGATGEPVGEVLKGSTGFIACQVLMLAILYYFPQIIMWLPNMAK